MTDEKTITECELGPIRPPSEATSLLLRVTRNCPWNKCAFCAVYKRTKFSRRETDELIAEIDLLADAAQQVRELAAGRGESGEVSSRTVLDIVHSPGATEEQRRVALWLNRGGQHVFLQDADSLIVPTRRLVPVLEHLHARFPTVNRVTTYARSRTLVARSPEQLAELRRAGLTRIHVGLESGSDAVLELVSKGCRAEHHVDGCRRVVEGGFELCCYVMPGLGGRALSEDHARETARVLREIEPAHVRLRTLWIDRGSPLEELYRAGDFEPLEEDEIVAEIRLMLAGLEGVDSRLISDHDRNLLADLEGHLTDDWAELDQQCARLLELPPTERDAYVVARRSGYFRSLGTFLIDPTARDTFVPVAAELRAAGAGSLIKGIELKMGRRGI